VCKQPRHRGNSANGCAATLCVASEVDTPVHATPHTAHGEARGRLDASFPFGLLSSCSSRLAGVCDAALRTSPSPLFTLKLPCARALQIVQHADERRSCCCGARPALPPPGVVKRSGECAPPVPPPPPVPWCVQSQDALLLRHPPWPCPQVLSNAVGDLRYLRPAVAIVLAFVGVKLGLEYFGAEVNNVQKGHDVLRVISYTDVHVVHSLLK
jgi:hypothetical protein